MKAIKKKRIIVGGAGGTPTLNFIRSLQKVRKEFEFIGITSNKYDLAKIDFKQKYLVPLAKEIEYIPFLLSIIKETKPDFMHAQNDAEVLAISENREKLPVKIFLPAKETVRICVDKEKSHNMWQKANLAVPESISINTPSDLKKALKRFGKVWLRFKTGAFGHGSLPTEDFNFAKAWIDNYSGWGDFIASECLNPQRTITCLSIWQDGELIVSQQRKRLYWEFANRTISGVTGITGTGVTSSDKQVDRVALVAIKAIDKKPHGIFGVDLTYRHDNVPCPTEINIGRFFTTHHFFTEAGLNMPLIYIRLAFNETPPEIKQRFNPLPDGLAWVRGMDVLPVLTTIKKIDKYEQDFKKRLGQIK